MSGELIIKAFDLKENADENDGGERSRVREIFNRPRRRPVEVRLQKGAISVKHKAREPLTVLCLSDAGFFLRRRRFGRRAGFAARNSAEARSGSRTRSHRRLGRDNSCICS